MLSIDKAFSIVLIDLVGRVIYQLFVRFLFILLILYFTNLLFSVESKIIELLEA